jgi:hypothetical protein
MYVNENKGDKKDTYKSALILEEIFQYLFVHQKENLKKPLTKVKKTREEMKTTMENIKKVVAYSLINVFKKKNKVEERGTSGLGMKRERKSIEIRAQKMMRGRVEPYAVPIVVEATKQTIEVPQMTFP